MSTMSSTRALIAQFPIPPGPTGLVPVGSFRPRPPRHNRLTRSPSPPPPSYSILDIDFDVGFDLARVRPPPSPPPPLAPPAPTTTSKHTRSRSRTRQRTRTRSSSTGSMPRAVSIPARLPARLYRRAPPPPENRLYHKDYTPPTASSSSSEHLTLESADGVSFYIPTYLVRRSWFFDDLISVPGPKGVVCLDAISASVLAFELACAGDSRRTRRHSAPPLQPRRQSRAPDGSAVRGSGLAFGFAATSHPPLIPPCAWSWQFLKQVLDLAFAFNLTHALERLAADSGEFYDPVLGYTLWALVAAAKGERESGTRSPPGTTGNAGAGTGVAFPSASAASQSASASPPNSTLLAWAHQLLRYDGAIPAWCTWALRTHVPDALSALEGLFAARAAVNAQIAASDARIAAGATARQKEASWEEGLMDMNAPPSITITNTSAAAHDKPLQRRKSLRGAKTQPTKCTPACRPTLKRKLTAAVGLVTRQSITEKFGTVEYFVEYTYEGIACPACRDKAKEALVWVWCMKGPWHGGMGL